MPGKIVPAAPVPPFVTFVASAVPMVFDNSMSYYEALCALWKWLQDDVINVINNNASVTNEYIDLTNEYIEKFNELKTYVDTYFDNLDVQEEINNKLDQMVEDGTLQEIITTYIQSAVAWTFDTVSDMQSATNLINGSYAQTLGYYSVDDGGKSLYKIKNTGVADGGNVIALSGGLYAHLIVKDEVYVEQFGAAGDGLTDDQDAINLAMSSNAHVIKFVGGKTYMVKGYETGQSEGSTPQILSSITGIVIPSNKIVDLNYAKVKIIANARQNYNIFTLENVDNVILKNGYIEGDVNSHSGATGEWGYGVSLRIAKNVVLHNLHITKCWGDGINLNNDGEASDFNENVTISNCICDDNRRQGMSVENADHLIVEGSKFINTGKTARTNPTAGVDVEPAYDYAKNITFVNCEFSKNYNSGLVLDGANITNVTVDKCLFEDNETTLSNSVMFVNSAKQVKIVNSKFINNLEIIKINVFDGGDGVIFENNVLYDVHCHLVGSKSTSSVDYIRNNEFYLKLAAAYNSVIEVVSNSSNKNELVVEGNTFENISENASLNVDSTVTAAVNKGYVKLIVRGNILKGMKKGITTGIATIIENNNFVGGENFPIRINDSISDLSSECTVIKGNIFECTAYTTYARYVMNSQVNVPMVLIDNTLFSKPLNNGLEISYPNNYIPNSWYNNTPSNLVADNNNIVTI